MTSRWFAFRLDSICFVFITFATFGCILFRNGEKYYVLKNRPTDVSFSDQSHVYLSGLEAGEVGLVLTYAVTLVGNFQWTMRQSAEVENMVRSEAHLSLFLCQITKTCKG